MPDVNVTIIGGGVVGLAIAAELAPEYSPLYVLERNSRYGHETSSRNSEVIHAGIYYPHNSLKALLCVEGRDMLYHLCERQDLPYKRITKIITAIDEQELAELEKLFNHGIGNGVELHMLTAREIHALEPNIHSAGGIFSPTTGIISAHGLMDYFHHKARQHGAEIQTQCEVVGLEKHNGHFTIDIRETTGRSTFTTEWVINAAGLESDTIASLAGIDPDTAGYRLHYCKGSYFALGGPLGRCVSRLIYPAPDKESLGIHVVVDLNGRVKFGPDVEYLSTRNLNYAVDESRRRVFAEAARRIIPAVTEDDLTPDMSGVRAKLQAKGEPPKDFIIRHEADRGLAGMINLVGIDSPGLTASPAIARYVHRLMHD